MRIESLAIWPEMHVRIDVDLISTFTCVSFLGFDFDFGSPYNLVDLGYFFTCISGRTSISCGRTKSKCGDGGWVAGTGPLSCQSRSQALVL